MKVHNTNALIRRSIPVELCHTDWETLADFGSVLLSVRCVTSVRYCKINNFFNF